MKFNKVILENINLAIKDFNEKGLPDGFGARHGGDSFVGVHLVGHRV